MVCISLTVQVRRQELFLRASTCIRGSRDRGRGSNPGTRLSEICQIYVTNCICNLPRALLFIESGVFIYV